MATVSIVLTSYNHAAYLRMAIDSVTNQTFSDWELFIWDDVSSDNSWEIIQSYSDSRIKTIRNDRTRRYIYAINKTIAELATGRYVAIHHSDDVWEKEKLAHQVAYLDANPNIAAVFTHAKYIDEHGRDLGNDWFNVPNQSRAQWLRCFFLNENKLCHPSAMVRRDAYIKAGLYKLVHGQTDDSEMWTRLVLSSDIHVIPKKLTLHRKFSNGSNVSAPNPTVLARYYFECFEQKKHYLSLTPSQILEIFPEAKQWLPANEVGDQGFLLAMVAIHLGNCPGTRLFGLDLLYRLLIDPIMATKIYNQHCFNYLDFISLTGQHELFFRPSAPSDAPSRVASAIFYCRRKLSNAKHRIFG